MLATLPEKLKITEDKNLLIQGLPSSIEKEFAKLSFAKNVTPLLMARKISVAIIFAVNVKQLNGILKDIFPALKSDSTLWVAHPKITSKIATDLNANYTWDYLTKEGYSMTERVDFNHVWSAAKFVKETKKLNGKKLTGKILHGVKAHHEVEELEAELV